MNAKAHLAFLHTLPCVVTYALTGERVRAQVVHHPESVRDENSHFAGIPMLKWRHNELHRLSRRGFEARTKLSELDMLAITMKLIQEGR